MKSMNQPKVMIAVPMQGQVCADFFESVLGLQTNGNTKICTTVNSLVYDGRNKLALEAIKEGFDYILWVDSDMTFPPDALLRLLEDAQSNGAEYVSGLCFSRKLPTVPVICKKLTWEKRGESGVVHDQDIYLDYPKDALFEVDASGAAFCLVKVSLIREVAEHFRMSPFHPLPFMGEDYSFCWRAKQLGKKLYCDSRVKIGHVGTMIFDERVFLAQLAEEKR